MNYLKFELNQLRLDQWLKYAPFPKEGPWTDQWSPLGKRVIFLPGLDYINPNPNPSTIPTPIPAQFQPEPLNLNPQSLILD